MITPTISPGQVKQRMATGQPCQLIDVRTPGEFARVHATGALCMPLDTLNAAAVTAMRTDDQQPLYVLCHSGARAGLAVDRLAAAGAVNVHRVEGGTVAWQKAGLPVQVGRSGAISIERQVRIAAGSLVLASIALAWRVHPAFIGIAAFVAAGLIFAGVTDTCGMGLLLLKMPWNRSDSCGRLSALTEANVHGESVSPSATA